MIVQMFPVFSLCLAFAEQMLNTPINEIRKPCGHIDAIKTQTLPILIGDCPITIAGVLLPPASIRYLSAIIIGQITAKLHASL